MTFRRSGLPLLIWLAAATTTGCVASSLEPLTFTARYAPVGSALDIATVPACAAIQGLSVSDERRDGRVVGHRNIQDQPDEYEIFLDGDVAGWLRSGLQRAFDQASLRRDDSAEFQLDAKLTVLAISEVAYVNSEYEARVVIDLELRLPGAS